MRSSGMRYIYRDDKQKQWIVKISASGNKNKYAYAVFKDHAFDGEYKSLSIAKKYRDAKCHFLNIRSRPSSSTGILGVFFIPKYDYCNSAYYAASWYVDGKEYRKYWSINKYGDLAFKLACQYRDFKQSGNLSKIDNYSVVIENKSLYMR